MIYPSIDKLLEKVDTKYSLVVAVARRARALKDGSPILIEKHKSYKYVGIALEEVYKDKVIIYKD